MLSSQTLAIENDSIKVENRKKKVQFHIRPSLGLTYGDSKVDGIRTTNLQWLGTVSSNFVYIGTKFDLSSALFIQYGESKIKGQKAEKLQDALIISITPSIAVIKKPKIRLFLETTAETNLGKGTVNNLPTSFLDPLFLYQTLFLGQKYYSNEKSDKTTWKLTYGLGYAFQQTFNRKSGIQQSLTGNMADFESGFSGIIEFNLNSRITESLSFLFDTKAVALSRENFLKDFDASRRSLLVRSGLFYKRFGIEYNYHKVHDLNLSASNMVNQSIMLTITF
ncbi:MAG: hypothetical protein NTY07_18940 [Bacteroidia bacterium]|nr:hypothetical protein [Bacteroidia bacterium]